VWWDFLQLKVSLPIARDALEPWLLIPDGLLYHPRWTYNWILPAPLLFFCAHSRQIFIRSFSRFVPPPHVIFVAAGAISLGINMIATIYAADIGADHITYEAGLGNISMAWLTIANTFAGDGFIIGLVGYGLIRVVSETALASWYLHSALARLPTVGLLFLACGVAVAVGRRRAMLSSSKLIDQDQVLYDSLWQSLYESEDGKAGFVHLDKVVQMIGLDAGSHCRQ